MRLRRAAGTPHEPRQLALRLADLLERSRPVPLTGERRVSKRKAEKLLDAITGEGSDRIGHAAAAVREALHHAKPVPLTDEVRLPAERVEELVRELRTAAAR